MSLFLQESHHVLQLMHMFLQFRGAVEIYSKYITLDWIKVTVLDLATRVVTGIVLIRQSH